MEEKMINIEEMKIKELDTLKENYKNITMPEEQLDKLKLAINKGKMDNRRERSRIVRTRITASAAAILAAFIILPNTSSGVAHAMGKVPVLGNFVRLVTWRDYKYEDERLQADVEVDKLELAMVEEEAATGSIDKTDVTGINQMMETEEAIVEYETEEAAVVEMKDEVLKESLDNINLEIEEITGCG